MSVDLVPVEDFSDYDPSMSRKSISTASPAPRSLNTSLRINARAQTDIMKIITLAIAVAPSISPPQKISKRM